MSLLTKVGFLAGAAATSLTGAALAGTSADVSYEDLQQRLDAAEAKITELSASQNADWMTEQRAEQVRGLVQDVLADADTRASLQGSGMTAGYDDGFVINSNDGNFSLKINGLMQNRWVYNHRNYAFGQQAPNLLNNPQNLALGNAAGSKNDYGFETTRAALNFSGTVGKGFYYNMRMQYSPYENTLSTGAGQGDLGIDWAYVGMDLGSDGWSLQLGQQKFDVMRAWMVNAEDQQFIERGNQVYYWGTSDYTNGLKLKYAGDSFRGNVMYSNGTGTGNNGQQFGNGNPGYVNNAADWAFSGRVEWKASGTWSQFDGQGSPQGSETGMLFGFGASAMKPDLDRTNTMVNAGAPGAGVNQTPGTQWLITADATMDFGGLNVGASFTYGDDEPLGVVGAFPNNISSPDNQIGWAIEAGYFLNADWELLARYQYLDTGMGDTIRDAGAFNATGPVIPIAVNGVNVTRNSVGSDNFKTLTIGANYYMSANAKLSMDWGYQWGGNANVGGAAYAGWQNTAGAVDANGNDVGGDTKQWMLRMQLQLSF